MLGVAEYDPLMPQLTHNDRAPFVAVLTLSVTITAIVCGWAGFALGALWSSVP